MGIHLDREFHTWGINLERSYNHVCAIPNALHSVINLVNQLSGKFIMKTFYHKRGAVRSAASSICSSAYGGWFAPRLRHSVRMTYRPSAALRLLGSLRISHNKFLRANK